LFRHLRELNKEKIRRREMNYYNTEVERDLALYIEKLETIIDKNDIECLKEDRRYIIELINVINTSKEQVLFTKAELKEIKEQLIKLI
jgi:hypothetical protein